MPARNLRGRPPVTHCFGKSGRVWLAGLELPLDERLTLDGCLRQVDSTLAAVAAAGPGAAKQGIEIQLKDNGNGDRFVLTPLGSGAIRADSGTVSFCCWTTTFVTRNGQKIRVNDPQMTLTGKRGTLVARNRIEWFEFTDGSTVTTGTWKVIRGTGGYAGLSGGGIGAGFSLANGNGRTQFEGFLSAR